jgi:putative endonuclease
MLPGWRNLPAGRQVGRLNMYFVYAITSLSRNYIYVGLTNNFIRRIDEHQGGNNRTTKAYRPFKLILLEEYKTRIEARQREKYLKNGVGKEFLKSL